MQCTATSKRTGERCRAQAVTGKTVCYHHGGRSLAGPASPSFKHGRYSRFLPSRLQDRYREAVADGELLALREDIALLDARLAEVLGRLDTGESNQVWQELQRTYGELRTARGSPERMAAALTAMGQLIEDGLADYAAWDDVRSLLDQRRRLVESERRRLVEMQQMLTAEQAMTLLAAVTDTIRRHVTDRNTLAAIATDLSRIVANTSGGSLDAAEAAPGI